MVFGQVLSLLLFYIGVQRTGYKSSDCTGFLETVNSGQALVFCITKNAEQYLLCSELSFGGGEIAYTSPLNNV